MKKLFTLLFFAVMATITFHVNAQNTWTQMANFPGAARYYDAGFSIGHYGFIGCGENNPYDSQYFDWYKWNQNTNTWSAIAGYPGTGEAAPISASVEGYGYVGMGFNVMTQTSQQDLWRYDTTSNTWTQMSSIPGPGRYDAGFFTIGHKIYVISGSTGGPPYLNDVWVYDTHTNIWTELGNSPAGYTDNLVAFSIGNHGYIGGGWDGNNVQSACWEYDTTTDTWTSIASLPIPVWADPRTFVIGSKAYVCNGLDQVPAPYYTLPDGFVYDTTTGAWSEFTNMGTNGIERGHCAAFTIGNEGYIGTGMDSLGNLLSSYWQFGPDTTTPPPPPVDTSSTPCNTWTQEAGFPGAPRYYDAGFSLGHYGFIGCGEANPYNSQYFDFDVWNQHTNQWFSIPNYPGTGTAAPVGVSVEGYGYVGMGFNVITQTSQQDLWRFDTTANSWTQMASIPGPGRYDAGFFVIGHKIYVISGSTGGPPYLNDVWVYDTHANTWTQLGNSPAGNTDNLVAFSIGSHGYIGGGWDGNTAQTACWKYDTTSDTWTSIASLPSSVWADPRTFVIGDRAYVCNGLYDVPAPGYTLPVGYVYDTVTGNWSEFTNMGSNGLERGHCVAFAIGNDGYIGTGMDSLGNLLSDFWQYGCIDSTQPQDTLNYQVDRKKPSGIYPNPSAGTFSMIYNGLETPQSEFRIVDLFDNIIYTSTINGNSGTVNFNENSLSNGMYFYRIISGGKTVSSGKIMVTK